MRFERSAGAVIFRHNPESQIEYLLLKRSGCCWNFPKGKLEKGENDIRAAERELHEETGLSNLDFFPGFKLRTRYFFRAPERNFEWTFKIVTYYLAEAINSEVKISQEHQDYQWLKFEEACEKTKDIRQIQKIIIKANAFIINNEKI
jgi:8-oxo-dGTP pyrophosphatase MutT (NUDIX family)